MSNPGIEYYIEHMASKEFIKNLFEKYGIRFRESNSYKKNKDAYCESGVEIAEDDFIRMCRSLWEASPIEYHKMNLSSGILKGHSWHKAMPSMLHYSLQEKVRECISANASVVELLDIARDIMKHEYFMVATHDICESLIIGENANTLPPTRKKSISDFIFNGIPFDLKVSTYPEDWSIKPCNTEEDKVRLAQSLVGGADSLRVRKEAEKASNGWGDNRFYIVVADQDRWIYDTNGLLEDIMLKVSALSAPLEVSVGGETILVHIVEA